MVRDAARYAVLALGLAVPLTACEDVTGPGKGSLSIRMSRDDAAPAAALVAADLVEASLGPVALEAIQSIDVTISAIQVQPAGADDDGGPWVTLDLTAPTSVNLLALPTGSGTGLLVATDEVEAGAYGHLRLLFSDATITFNQDVTLGANTYTAGTPYPLTIPSGAQTGIKLELGGIEVPEGGAAEVELVFDAALSVGNVLVTGSGILMTPVMHVAKD
ncbi:MAG TPA: DUF4382 domain-containing protein [Longimicrobiales bacterium]